MKAFKKKSLITLWMVLGILSLHAQNEYDPAYVKVTNERAQKIVDGMELGDRDKQLRVRDLIAEQYRSLSKIQDGRDAEIALIKESDLSEDKQHARIDKLKKHADKKIEGLHKAYIQRLSKELNEQQVVQVKDGMTYGVLPITYAGYLDMLPNLTEKQKKMIYDNLVEAREHAIDGGSSKEKHAWFGKYKGRINNNLSADGYDLNKESKDWHERIEGRKKKND